MGVYGLMGMMKERHEDKWTEEEVDTFVVDGYAFIIVLYQQHCGWKLGGDYSRFMEVLGTFLDELKEDEIKVTFVFDGGTPQEKIETELARQKDKCLVVQANLAPDVRWAQHSRNNNEGPTPALIAPFAKHVMQERGVNFLTADVEADAPIGAEAVRQGAFVASNDSDFMLMTGPKGMVLMEHFVGRAVGGRRFRALSADAVAKALGLRPARLPELGTLAGNDYILKEWVEGFHEKVLQVYDGPRETHPRWRLLQALAVWLQKRDASIWQKDKELEKTSRELWDYSLRSYRSDGAGEEISDKGTSLRLHEHGQHNSAVSPGTFPTWLARAFRLGPAFPGQLIGVMATGVHLAPQLVEPLKREGEASVWAQSLPLRVAAAGALGLKAFVDVTPTVAETDGCFIIDFRKQTHVVASLKGLPGIPPRCSELLASVDGPQCAEDREEVLEHFYAVLRWEAKGSRPSEELLPQGRWLQLAALRYWVATHGGQEGERPRWVELAALLLLLIMPPEARAEVCRHIQPPAEPLPAKARALAGFESCLISTMEFHAAMGAPLGLVDFNHLYDGPFLHALASGKKLQASELLKDDLAKQQQFDAALRHLLESLKGQMKPHLQGSAKLKGAAWQFSDSAPPSGGKPACKPEGAADVSQQRKKLMKKLDQIAKLEAKGGALSKEEAQKVSQKAEFEAELKGLEDSATDPTLLELWNVLRP